MNHLDYLVNCIKVDFKPSSVNGIGAFALRDIQVGEEVFPKWEGETKLYMISHSEFESLPLYTKRLILKSYENHRNELPFIWFRLFKDSYFNVANPWCFVNTKEENGNIHSELRVAKQLIKEGEEIFGTYKLSNTIL